MGGFQNGATMGTAYTFYDDTSISQNGLDYPSTQQNYPVQAGDTLQSIAQALWGESNLWYLIGDATGITDPQHDAEVGEVLIIPNHDQSPIGATERAGAVAHGAIDRSFGEV